MDAVKELIPLALALSLSLLVLVIGLDSPVRDLLAVLRRPGRLAAAVLAVNVIPPVAALVLLHLVDVSAAAQAGIILMAISPAPPLVPGKLVKLTGEKAYAYGLYAALILLAIVVVPAWVYAIHLMFGVDVAIAPRAVAANVAVTFLAPLAVGVAIHKFAPSLAARAAPVVYKLAMVVLFAAAVPVVIKAWPAMAALAGDGTFLVMGLVVVIAFAAGAVLGGSEPENKAALAAAAATRHPGIAMLIAKANFDNPQIAAAVLGFLLVGLVVSIPCQAALKRVTVAA